MQLVFMLLMLLFCSNAWAEDYWVYIRIEDRVGPTTADTAGRSKRGDIVDIRPVNNQNVPTETEKKSYLIVKVTDLTDSDIVTLLEAYNEDVTVDGIPQKVSRAYRKKLLNFDTSRINAKVGLVDVAIPRTKVMNYIANKTALDLAKYEAKTRFYAYIQRPLIIADNIITRRAFAATVVSKINTATEDYNTLTLWEDDKDGDLVTATTIQQADVYNDQGVLGGFTLDGSTTSADYYMYITAPSGERHLGIWGNGVRVQSTTDYANLITISDPYTRMEWLELEININNGGNQIVILSGGVNTGTTIANCMFYGNSVGNNIIGIIVKGDDRAYIVNNICYKMDDTCFKSDVFSNPDTQYYNNTSTPGTIRMIANDDGSTTVDCYNNLCLGSSTCFDDCDGALTNNASSDTTADGTSNDSLTCSNEITSCSEPYDVHLLSTSNVLNEATDMGSSYSIDIDGTTRSGTWDIGADEYVSAAAPPYPIMLNDSVWNDTYFQ